MWGKDINPENNNNNNNKQQTPAGLFCILRLFPISGDATLHHVFFFSDFLGVDISPMGEVGNPPFPGASFLDFNPSKRWSVDLPRSACNMSVVFRAVERWNFNETNNGWNLETKNTHSCWWDSKKPEKTCRPAISVQNLCGLHTLLVFFSCSPATRRETWNPFRSRNRFPGVPGFPVS